jgi:hypothetical protein
MDLAEEVKTYLISTFSAVNSREPDGRLSLGEMLKKIRSDIWADAIKRCRKDPEYKTHLPVFTPTGTFHRRGIAGLEQYNGLICLDIDHVENPEDLKEKCRGIPWVFAAFVTPGGKGLKVMVPTHAGEENYRQMEEEVANAFEEVTGFARDRRCKDISRVQYVSWDPLLLINDNCQKYHL